MCGWESLWCRMKHYSIEEKFVKVCEGMWSGDEGCDERREIKMVWC